MNGVVAGEVSREEFPALHPYCKSYITLTLTLLYDGSIATSSTVLAKEVRIGGTPILILIDFTTTDCVTLRRAASYCYLPKS